MRPGLEKRAARCGAAAGGIFKAGAAGLCPDRGDPSGDNRRSRGGLRRRWFLLAEADARCGGTGGGLDVGCKSARRVGGLPSDYLF